MRLTTSAQLEEFRSELRAFIADHNPGVKTQAGVRAPEADLMPRIREWTAALFEAGYLGIQWPEEHGGRPDADPREPFVVAEEIARARTWEPVGAGQLAASALLEFGSQEQQRRYLPRIRSAADVWCQLFSEPAAGSDLASLQTRARREGDEFVVDGQKVWTTNGQHADMGYLLARTNPDVPKHKGITAFALDLRSPGVDVRPLREMTGTEDFNEVFLTDVHIPAANVIGAVDDGWRVANSSLMHERSGVAAMGVELYRVLDDLAALATTRPWLGGVAADDDGVRRELGRFAARVQVNDLMSKAAQSRMVAHREDPADAPAGKVFFSELYLDLAEAGLRLLGPDGALVEGDPDVVAGGWWEDAFLYARAFTIAGGSNEVLRNVLAERVLGLPRDPA